MCETHENRQSITDEYGKFTAEYADLNNHTHRDDTLEIEQPCKKRRIDDGMRDEIPLKPIVLTVKKHTQVSRGSLEPYSEIKSKDPCSLQKQIDKLTGQVSDRDSALLHLQNEQNKLTGTVSIYNEEGSLIEENPRSVVDYLNMERNKTDRINNRLINLKKQIAVEKQNTVEAQQKTADAEKQIAVEKQNTVEAQQKTADAKKQFVVDVQKRFVFAHQKITDMQKQIVVEKQKTADVEKQIAVIKDELEDAQDLTQDQLNYENKLKEHIDRLKTQIRGFNGIPVV